MNTVSDPLSMFASLQTHTQSHIWVNSSSPWSPYVLLLAAALVFYALRLFGFLLREHHSDEDNHGLPTVSYTPLPRSILNLQFASSALRLLEDGYQKFRDRAFKIIRGDGDIVVLPSTLLEELVRLPDSVASSHHALEKDLLGTYTGLDIILESRMHHTIVQRKLTPRLGLLTPALHAELTSAFDDSFPVCSDSEWTEFQPYQVFAKVAARLTSRAIVGEQFCRNPVWLDVAINYTENLFRTIVVLRLVPRWMRMCLYRFLPSYWEGQNCLANARKLLSPVLSELLRKNDAGTWTPQETPEEFTVMHWLADSAKGKDRNADTLAHVEVLLALASTHTTLLRAVNVLYDLVANPGYLADLLDEISEVHASQGNSWPASSYERLHRLDSVLRESQRMSPPTTMGLKRVFKQNHVFANGLLVKAGTYVCLPTYAIENSTSICPNPDVFDGMRSYRLWQQQSEKSAAAGSQGRNGDKFAFSSIDETTLGFGYGKQACPGRFFASLILKMMFVKMLTEYEFDFLPGSARPKNYTLHEFLFCWPWQRALIKRKPKALGVQCPI